MNVYVCTTVYKSASGRGPSTTYTYSKLVYYCLLHIYILPQNTRIHNAVNKCITKLHTCIGVKILFRQNSSQTITHF